MNYIAVFLVALILTSCASIEKWSTYKDESSESKIVDGVTYYLAIKSKRRDFDIDPLILTGSSGPPYHLSLHATTNSDERMPTIRIAKIRMTMPGGQVYDVLQGDSISVAPEEHSPSWVRYRSSELPLEFIDGGEVYVELHCLANGRDVVIRKKFVGRKGRSTSSVWDAYWSV